MGPPATPRTTLTRARPTTRGSSTNPRRPGREPATTTRSVRTARSGQTTVHRGVTIGRSRVVSPRIAPTAARTPGRNSGGSVAAPPAGRRPDSTTAGDPKTSQRGAVVVLVSSPLGVSAGVLLIVGTAIGQYVGFGGVALGYLSNRGFTWEQMRSYLGVRVPTLRELAVVVAGYVAVVLLLVVVAGIASMFLPEPAENQAVDTTTENPGIVPFMILMMFLVVGPMEELLFRGIVQNRLRERFPAIPAIAIASAIFAAVHVVALAGSLTGMLVTVFILFFPATVFGAVYEYTGNLVVPALLHALHNSVIVGLIFLAPEEAGSILALVALAGL
ncbi:hypothetical protein BRC87_01490 [Halobacteriales archaeon QS_4_66_20]|nr:MAG: hypothetical protein BRC87_01490 [Halobacteriales archaeon QS_4_66_20]